MADTRLRPFRPDDLLRCTDRDGGQPVSLAQVVEQSHGGPAFTLEVGNKVVAMAGVLMPWPGMGQAWMVVADGVDFPGMQVTRYVRRVLVDVARAQRLHRIETVALADSARNQRWIEALGFTREKDGLARRYFTDGRDVLRYEWLKEHA